MIQAVTIGRNKIAILFLIWSSCSSESSPNLVIHNTSMKVELSRFKSKIIANRFDEESITVYLSSNDSMTNVMFVNDLPKRCDHLLGYSKYDGVNVFVVADTTYSSIVEIIRPYRCEFESKDAPKSNQPPIAVHHLEQFYTFQGDSLLIVRVPKEYHLMKE
jgi:hypothetical protein